MCTQYDDVYVSIYKLALSSYYRRKFQRNRKEKRRQQTPNIPNQDEEATEKKSKHEKVKFNKSDFCVTDFLSNRFTENQVIFRRCCCYCLLKMREWNQINRISLQFLMELLIARKEASKCK